MTLASNRKRNRLIISAILILVLSISLASALYLTRNSSSPNLVLHDRFDYNLGVYPTNGTVQQGSSLVTNINMTYMQGSPDSVSLVGIWRPKWHCLRFLQQTGTPTSNNIFTSNLTIILSPSAPTDTYSINVTSTAANGKTYNASYILTVLNTEIQVSGTVNLNSSPNIVPSQIEFVDAYSTYTATVHFDLSNYP